MSHILNQFSQRLAAYSAYLLHNGRLGSQLLASK